MIAVTGPFPSNQHTTYPPAGRHHRAGAAPSARPRRRFGFGAIVGISVAVLAVLVGVGFVVTAVIRPPVTPDADPPVAAAANPVTVRLGETLRYRAGKISAEYVLTSGRPLSLTPSGSRPSRGAFLGLTATVSVESGSVYLTDDNFVLITSGGREFEPDVSFLFDGGLRGARAGDGQKVSGLVVWDIPVGDEAGAKIALRLGAEAVQGYWQLP
jgi:hypothetical protein